MGKETWREYVTVARLVNVSDAALYRAALEDAMLAKGYCIATAPVKFRLRYILNLLVPGLPESEGAQAARTDAELGDEDLPWERSVATDNLTAKQPEMDTGAEVKKVSH